MGSRGAMNLMRLAWESQGNFYVRSRMENFEDIFYSLSLQLVHGMGGSNSYLVT